MKDIINRKLVSTLLLILLGIVLFTLTLANSSPHIEIAPLYLWSIELITELLTAIELIAILFYLFSIFFYLKVKKEINPKKILKIKKNLKSASLILLLCLPTLLIINHKLGNKVLNNAYTKNKMIQNKFLEIEANEVFKEASWSDLTKKHAEITGRLYGLGTKSYAEYHNYIEELNLTSKVENHLDKKILTSFFRAAYVGFDEESKKNGGKVYISENCILIPESNNVVESLLCRNYADINHINIVSSVVTNQRFAQKLIINNAFKYEFLIVDLPINKSKFSETLFLMNNMDYNNCNLGYVDQSESMFLFTTDYEECNPDKVLYKLKDEKLILPHILKEEIKPQSYSLKDFVYIFPIQ